VAVSESPTIDQLLDDAALMSFEHQEHLIQLLGQHRWDVAFQPPRFTFTGDHSFECTRLHVLGSAAPGPSSWLWSWANVNAGYPAEVTALAESVREFGARHDIALLAEGEVPFEVLPGAPNDPGRVAWIMGELAKAVSGTWTSYTGDIGRGSRLLVLLEHPDLGLPPAGRLTISRVLEAVFRLQLPDHRRAIHSYAVRRDLNPVFSADQSVLSLTGPDFETVIRFDEQGLVVATSTSHT
jgi:hypothetical protein